MLKFIKGMLAGKRSSNHRLLNVAITSPEPSPSYSFVISPFDLSCIQPKPTKHLTLTFFSAHCQWVNVLDQPKFSKPHKSPPLNLKKQSQPLEGEDTKALICNTWKRRSIVKEKENGRTEKREERTRGKSRKEKSLLFSSERRQTKFQQQSFFPFQQKNQKNQTKSKYDLFS